MQSKHRNIKKEHDFFWSLVIFLKNLKVSKCKVILANLHHSLGIRANEI